MNCCTFIGHRDCPQNIKQDLFFAIEKLIIAKDVSTFYVGTQGSFDRLVYGVLNELKREYDIKIIVVLAYLDNNKNTYYDMSKTEFPSVLDDVPLKYAIKKRNEYMLKSSQYLICYINNTFSNAYKFINVAKRYDVHTINLGELPI